MSAPAKRFEGREIAGVQLKLSNAVVSLDGSARFQVGDVVHVVVEAQVERVIYSRITKSDRVLRVERAGSAVAALIDSSIALDAIEKARIADESLRGIMRLSESDDGEAAS